MGPKWSARDDQYWDDVLNLTQSDPLDTSWIYWPLANLVPWLLLLWAARIAAGRMRRMLRIAAFGAVFITVVVGGLVVVDIFNAPTTRVGFALMVVTVPFVLSGWLRRNSGAELWPRWYTIGLFGFGAVLIAMTAWLTGM